MVASGAISPKESYAAVDHETIVLLFAMMLLSVYLDESRVFIRLSSWLIRAAGTPFRLLVGVSLLAASSAAFLLNDTVCVFMTPLVVTICRRSRLPMGPYLIALGTSANIGSAATLIGNPQNMLIGSMSGMGFVDFAAAAVLPTVIGLVVNIVLLGLYYRHRLPKTLAVDGDDGDHSARVPTAFITALEAERGVPAIVVVVVCVVIGFFLGFDKGYTALAGVAAMVILKRADPRPQFAQIDWTLLVFFASLFIVVAAFAKTGLVDQAWAACAPLMNLETGRGLGIFTAALTLGSNLVSNVPLVLLLGPRLAASGAGSQAWVLLGFVTTVAGNLTLVGSVANLIVAETAREHYTLGFGEYLRFGVTSTILVLVTAVPLSLALRVLE